MDQMDQTDQPFLETLRQNLRDALRKRSTGEAPFPESFKISTAPVGGDHPFCSHCPQWEVPQEELDQVMEEVPGLGHLERLGKYFCFCPAEAAYDRAEIDPKPILTIELREHWRSQEVHQQLKEVKRVLNRFRKLTVDLVEQEHSFPARPDQEYFQIRTSSERKVIEAEYWVIYQLWNRRDPWPVSGLAELLGGYAHALKDCWGQDRIDGEGDPFLSALRTRRWAANGRMIRSLLKALQP